MIKTIFGMVKYDLYKVKLLLLRLVVETYSHAALYVQVSSVYLSPKWTGSLCCVFEPAG